MRLCQPQAAWLAAGAVFFAWLFGGDLPLALAYFLVLTHFAAFLAAALDRTSLAPAQGTVDLGRGGHAGGSGEIRLLRGERLRLELVLRNRAPWPAPAEVAWAPRPGKGADAFRPPAAEPAFVEARRAGSAVELRSGPLPRGVFPVPPVRVRRTDPLGLFAREEGLALPLRMVVTPRRRELRAGSPLELALARAQGARHGLLFPDPSDWTGVRPYRPGDDRRLIHWRSSARRGQLQVLDFHRASARGLALALDPDPFGQPEAWETAIEAALALARRALAEGLPVWLWEPAAGPMGTPLTREAVEEALADARPRRDPGFAGRLVRIARTAPRAGLALVLAATLAPSRRHDLISLAAEGVPLAVVTFDGPEAVLAGDFLQFRFPTGDAFGPLAEAGEAPGEGRATAP